MAEQDDREAKLREIAKKTVLYRMPGTDDVFVRSATYNAGQTALPMDIYYPKEPAQGDRLPLVIIAFGYADPEGNLRRFGPVTSWARLIAASGMATVIYANTDPAENIHAVLAHLRTNAAALNVDEERIGLYAASANVAVALSALMRDAGITAASLLCGYTMDLDGSTGVADAAKQFLFANACAGKTVDDLPADVPMLFVRAGRDQFPGINEALDKVIVRALARNLPLTFINYPSGVHGFEFEEDTDVSRDIVQQVLTFLRTRLIGRE